MAGALTVANLLVNVSADVSDLNRGIGQAESAIDSFSGKASGALGTLGKFAAGAAVAGIAAVGAGFAGAVSAASNFESTMSAVKAVSGATADEMAGLSKLALQLGKDTSFSAAEAGKGIEELVKGGLSIQDIMGGAAKSTLDLAAAGGISLPDAATIAANALAQFGLKGEDMAHVADLIAGAANASALDVGQFKYSLQAAGAVASTVGFSFDDLAQAIAVMGKAGITGSDAGTSLKTMMMSLVPSTDKAKNLMKQLGIITEDGANRFFDATGKVKSMAEVAEILKESTEGLTQAQKIQALETLFGSDAIRAASVLAKEGAAGFNEMAEAMSKVTAESVGAEKLNNLRGSWEQLTGSLETLGITFGMSFLPLLRQGVDGLTEFVNTLIPVAEKWGPVIAEYVGGAFERVRAAVADALPVIAKIVSSFTELFDLFGDNGGASLLEQLMPPEVSRVVLDIVGKLKEGFSGVGEAFMEVFGGIVSWFTENWPLIQQVGMQIILGLAKAWETHGANIATIVRSVWTIIKTTIGQFLDTIGSLTRAFLQLMTGDWQGSLETLRGFIERTMNRAKEAFGATWDGIIALIDIATGGMLTKIGNWMSDTKRSIEDGMKSVSTTISNAWDAVLNFIPTILSKIRTAITTIWNMIPEDIRKDLEKIATHIVTAGATWLANMTAAGQNMLTSIVSRLDAMVQAVTTWATSTFLNPIRGLVTTAGATAADVGSSIMTAITSKLAEIVSAITTWADSTFLAPLRGLIETARGIATSIGQAIIDGILQAVRAGASSLSSAIGTVVRGALQAAKDALGIESPSKLFDVEVGQQMILGAIGGINAQKPALMMATKAAIAPAVTAAVDVVASLSQRAIMIAEAVQKAAVATSKAKSLRDISDIVNDLGKTIGKKQLPEPVFRPYTEPGSKTLRDISDIVNDLGRTIGRSRLPEPIFRPGSPTDWATDTPAGRGLPEPIFRPYARGGWITEPVVGRGLATGHGYTFAERGPEYVVPSGMTAGAAGDTYYVTVQVNGNALASKEDIATAVVIGLQHAQRTGRTKLAVI